MKTSIKIALATAMGAALASAGCDLTRQLSAQSVAVSTLLTTPPIQLTAAAIAGNGLDASISLPPDAGITLPSQTLVYVFFGQRQGESLDVAPVGAAGATVTLWEFGGRTWTLADQGGGNYALDAVDAGFTYKDGATYNFAMALGGVVYQAEVARVPAREPIARFHEGPGYVALDAGEPLAFWRVEPPPGEERPLGFVTVLPISLSGAQATPTWTNVPATPLEFLKLVLAPNDWRKTVVTIPGSAFPAPDHNYVVLVQSAKLGGPVSDNLFAGSAILAGTAEVAVVRTNR